MIPGSMAGQIVTGAEYVRQITVLQSDRRARAAFCDLALSIAPLGATLLDFGAGTGIDARFYADCGRIVAAYDVDPRMCEFFADHCRDLIEARRVTLETGSYREFLARQTGADGRSIDLVTSNFAPLNLVDDLHQLFATFHARTNPNGKVLASVLNPYCLRDARYRWWWRNALRLLRDGRFSVAGAQAPIVRRRLADIASQAAPNLSLARVFPGLPSRRGPAPRDRNGYSPGPGSWTRLLSCRYMFLLFEKHALPERGNSN